MSRIYKLIIGLYLIKYDTNIDAKKTGDNNLTLFLANLFPCGSVSYGGVWVSSKEMSGLELSAIVHRKEMNGVELSSIVQSDFFYLNAMISLKLTLIIHILVKR